MCTIITGELKYKKIYVRRILRVFNDEPKIDYSKFEIFATGSNIENSFLNRIITGNE